MKARILSIVIVMLMLVPQAFAAQLHVETFLVDRDTQRVIVEGRVIGAEYNQMVTLRVTYDEDESVNYMTQKAVEIDGSFLIAYKMTGNAGSYTAHMNTNRAEEDFTEKFVFSDMEQVRDVIEQINKKRDAKSLFTYISNGEVQTTLQIDWNKLTGIGSVLKACELVIKEKTVFDTATSFVEMLTSKVVLTGINEAKEENRIIELIDRYGELLQITKTKRYKQYSNDSNLQEGTAKRIISMEFSDVFELLEAFEEQVILEKIKQVGGYGEIYDILIENNDLLLLDFSVYNTLTAKNSVLKGLAGNDYITISKVKEDFNNACNSQREKESTPPPSPVNKNNGGGSSPYFINTSNEQDETENTETEKPIEPNKKYFTDLGNHIWAEENINFLYEKGIISGNGDGLFNPQNHVTREEFIKMLTLIFKFTINEAAEQTFTDVNPKEWYAKYVYSAANAGILSGYPDGSLGIGENISREDIAVIMKRALDSTNNKLERVNKEKIFTDAGDIAEYAYDSVVYMQSAGVIHGFEDGRFAPKNNATRAEAARMLYFVYVGLY